MVVSYVALCHMDSVNQQARVAVNATGPWVIIEYYEFDNFIIKNKAKVQKPFQMSEVVYTSLHLCKVSRQ